MFGLGEVRLGEVRMNKIFFGWTCTDLRDFKSSKGGHLDPGRHLFPRIELRDDDDGTC